MKNRAKEVQARIKELINAREKTTASILEKIEAERRAEAAAQEAIAKATAALDFEMNHKAQQDNATAAEHRALLQRRLDQMNSRKMVTEEESNEVISSLLKYEEDLAAEFEEAVSAPLETLANLCKEYQEKVQETEATINKWTHEIHPNYLSPGTKYADGTNRAPQPVPVHIVAYSGSVLSNQIDNFLRNVWPLKK